MLDRRQALFVVLACSFVSALVLGDTIGGKLVDVTLFGVTFPISVGMIPFPITFLLTDLINEFYGQRAARFVTLVGLGVALGAFVMITLAAALPIAELTKAASWTGVTDVAFNLVLNSSQRIFLASMVAYVIAQFLDMAVFHLLKARTHNAFLWLRATGSTLVSQLVDTLVIQFLAWVGKMSFEDIVKICLTSYLFKLVVAVGLTPVIYGLHAVVEKKLGLMPERLGEDGQPLAPERAA